MNNTPMKRQAPRRMFRLLRGLAICAGAFRARHLPLWQVVFSKGRRGRYDAPH